jgi:hypothetical protein
MSMPVAMVQIGMYHLLGFATTVVPGRLPHRGFSVLVLRPDLPLREAVRIGETLLVRDRDRRYRAGQRPVRLLGGV